MSLAVDFYYGLGSRYSYLASTQLERIAAETGCRFDWHPLKSGALMELRGGHPFHGEPASGQYEWPYRRLDAEAWAEFYGVPYREPVGFLVDPAYLAVAATAAKRLDRVRIGRNRDPGSTNPVNPVYINSVEQIHAVDRIAVGDSNQPRSALGAVEAYSRRLFQAIFVEGVAVAEAELIGFAADAGLETAAFRAQLEDPATAEMHAATLREAHRRGAFGVPTFFVGEQMFWGNDRLPLVAHFISKARAGGPA